MSNSNIISEIFKVFPTKKSQEKRQLLTFFVHNCNFLLHNVNSAHTRLTFANKKNTKIDNYFTLLLTQQRCEP